MAQLRWLYPEVLTDKEKAGLLRRGTRTPQISGKPGSLTWSDIGASISAGLDAQARANRAQVEGSTKFWSDVGDKLTTPAKTAGRPRGPVRGVERVPYKDLTAKANKEATNDAVNNVSTNEVDKGTSNTEQTAWEEKTRQTQNPGLWVSDRAPEQGGSAASKEHAQKIESGDGTASYWDSDMEVDTPSMEMKPGADIPTDEAITKHIEANQGGLKISKSQAADLMAMVGKKLMEPKARKGGPMDLNNPHWRASRGYGGSDFIRSWG